MAEYNLDDLFEDVVINIGGQRFKLRERTKSLSQKADKLEATVKDVTDETPIGDAVESMVEFLDFMLEPQGNGDGPKQHAKTVLLRAYRNDEVSADRIFALVGLCQDKMVERMDPTSATRTDG